MYINLLLSIFDTLVRNLPQLTKNIIAGVSFLLALFVFYKALKRKDNHKISLYVIILILIAISVVYLIY